MAVREVLRYPNALLKREARQLAPAEREGLQHRQMQHVVAQVVANEPSAEHEEHRDERERRRPDELCGILSASARRESYPDANDDRADEDAQLELVLVNPRVVASSGAEVAREGCLSIPDLTANVRRATHVTIEAGAPDGSPRAIETEGFEARCLLHELDHLDGILFLDRVDSLKTDVFRRKRYA